MTDCQFIKSCFKKRMRFLGQKYENLVEDVKPEISSKLSKAMESTAKKIYKNSREDIEKINKTIEKHFRIPDNVLLSGDEIYLSPPTKEDVEALEEECKQLQKTLHEVRLLIELGTTEL